MAIFSQILSFLIYSIEIMKYEAPIIFFHIHVSVHRESNLITVQQDATYSVYYIFVGSFTFFYVLLTVHLSIFISVINQLDAQNFCFTLSLFHASTCFEHMCSSSGG